MIIQAVILLLIQGTMLSSEDLQVAIQLMGEDLVGGQEGGIVQQQRQDEEVRYRYKPRTITYTKIPIKIKPEITQQTTLPIVHEVITQPPLYEFLPQIEIPFYPPTYPPPIHEFEPETEIPFEMEIASIYAPVYPPVYAPIYGLYPPIYAPTYGFYPPPSYGIYPPTYSTKLVSKEIAFPDIIPVLEKDTGKLYSQEYP